MTDTENTMITNIIGNFIADNIVFGMEVLAHHPEELFLEIWEFTDFQVRFLELSSGYEGFRDFGASIRFTCILLRTGLQNCPLGDLSCYIKQIV